MSYDTFSSSSPNELAVILIISLLLTLAVYGAFPTLFASRSKKPISKKKYKRLCFAVNIIPLLVFIVINGSNSGAPYFLWTWIFSNSGVTTLAKRNLLVDSDEKMSDQASAPVEEADSTTQDTATPSTPEAVTDPIVTNEESFSQDTTISDYIQPAVIKEEHFIDSAPACNRFCRKCGNQLYEDSVFCDVCGTKIIASSEIYDKNAVNQPQSSCPPVSVVAQDVKENKISSGKLIVTIVVLAILSGVGGLFIYDHNKHNKGIEAMNNQQFILAQQYFDDIVIKDASYTDEYAYIEAGVLMENGKYLDAYKALNSLNTPVPDDIIKDLEKRIYDAGVTAYRKHDLSTAKNHFNAIKYYKRSNDYIFLIDFEKSFYPSTQTYNRLLSLLNFEDAAELMASNSYCLQKFLVGRWETTSSSFYYFEIEEKEDGYRSWFNLPRESFYGKYYEISDGIYHQTNDDGDSRKFYRFSIINKDTIDVYCYKDNNTYRLTRQ